MIEREYLKKRSTEKVTTLLIFFFILCAMEVLNLGDKTRNSSNIYMLIWTTPEVRPFPEGSMEMMNIYFVNKKCKYQNCIVTNDKLYFSDIKSFDFVLFYCLDITNYGVPSIRPITQKYIFVSDEPLHYCELSNDYDGFFNLTWTFKFNSDATLKYFKVKNRKGKVIGPKTNMHWKKMKDMKPISNKLKQKLKSKSRAAAWFVSNCFTPSQREVFVENLQIELGKYQQGLDQFGICSSYKCYKNRMDECYAMLESDYYFYLAFENSFHEDYVTEKVLTAINHFSVPIVYGGANYTRFLPYGSYLNADLLGVQNLAKAMNEIINDKERYYDFFRWRRYYTYHDSREDADTDEICAFCEFLNKDKKLNRSSVYTHFKNFWY